MTLVRYLGHRAWWVGALESAVIVAGCGVFGLVFAGLMCVAMGVQW